MNISIQSIPGYLRDTKHLLSILQTFSWHNYYTWIMADVTSLYAVIPHDLDNLALVWFLDPYSVYSSNLKETQLFYV